MKKNQLTRGEPRRVMYVENKDGDIDGARARIGWVTFSKTGLSVHYRGRVLVRSKGRGIRGNFHDEATGEEYWVSGVKKDGSNAHWAESVEVQVDDDAREECARLRGPARKSTATRQVH
jgi:predicted lipid-binding transport protein (Tim44 family)